MIIQHNLPAMNAHRNLGINNAFTAKNLEKLSSGYRINRAGDDAAGLAISEKMRGQIRGLSMAEQNTSNAISLIQTAEGGLNETHAILQRMRELAVQSSNGTYDESVDRAQLEKEFKTIKEEIDRIAESTHYNGIKLLDGSLGGVKYAATDANITDYLGIAAATPAAGVYGNMTVTAVETPSVGEEIHRSMDIQFIKNEVSPGYDQTYTIQVTFHDADGDTTLTLPDYVSELGGSVTFGTVGEANSGTISSGTYEIDASAGTGKITITDGGGNTFEFDIGTSGADIKEGAIKNIHYTISDDGNSNAVASVDMQNAYVISGKGQLVFQIGANGGSDQRVGLQVGCMDSKNIGSAVYGMLDVASIKTQDDANKAIEIITAATNQVSGTRADLGALQNRLEHTMNNLGVTKENLTAAESTIRDVDMAKEMMEFTKNQILVQASQAMLAQANQLPQGVLNLLR